MKKLIFAIIVIVCIITIGVLEQVYLRKTFSEIKDEALEIQALIDTDIATAYNKSIELKNKWDDRKKLTEAVISHNETRELTLKISELEGYIKADDTKSATAVVNMLVMLCDNYQQILGFSWDTIF